MKRMKKMKRNSITFLLLPVMIVAMVGCGSPQQTALEEERARIIELNSLLYDKEGNLPGHKVAQEAIEAFRAFGNNHPDDSMALPYHIKAGDLAFTLGQFRLSADIFSEVVSLYPSGEHSPYVFIRLGSVYNDRLQDTAAARVYFTKVLDEFPSDPLAESAEFGIETLGMDEEEQFKVILKRSQMLADEPEMDDSEQ